MLPCRRHSKKRKDEEPDDMGIKRESVTPIQSPVCDPFARPSSVTCDRFDGIDSQLQSSHVSSTVFDSPRQNMWRSSSDALSNRSPIPSWFPISHGTRDWPKVPSSEGTEMEFEPLFFRFSAKIPLLLMIFFICKYSEFRKNSSVTLEFE